MSYEDVSRDTVIFGGAFNPFGCHHLDIIRELLKYFAHVIVVVCGKRSEDKPTVNDIDPIHRAFITDLSIADLPPALRKRVTVDLFDLGNPKFTRTYDLYQRYAGSGRIWFAVGTDLVKKGDDGLCEVERSWYRGAEVFQRFNFVVTNRKNFPVETGDLPPHTFQNRVLEPARYGSSTTIRARIFHHRKYADLVTEKVYDYIERYGLYRGVYPSRHGLVTIPDPRPLIVYDADNPLAVKIALRLHPRAVASDPNVILAIGGDGTLLQAVREHWRKRVPFCPLHATPNIGYNMNRITSEMLDKLPLLLQNRHIFQLPLLSVKSVTNRGIIEHNYAFNETCVQRDWVSIKVNVLINERELPMLYCDAVMVATAQGSTAYARSTGAPFLPDLGQPSLVLAVSNPITHQFFRYALLPDSDTVTLQSVELRRCLIGAVDGQPVAAKEPIDSMRIRRSNVAAMELIALEDLNEKRKLEQFSGLF